MRDTHGTHRQTDTPRERHTQTHGQTDSQDSLQVGTGSDSYSRPMRRYREHEAEDSNLDFVLG